MARCPFCDATGPNVYWLIDHVDHCAARQESYHHRPHPHHRDHRAKYLTIGIEMAIPQHRKHVRIHMADLSLKDSDPAANATVQLTDAAGNPTTADQTPTWAEDSNGTVITLSASDDGMSATITPVAPGVANVTFSVTDNDGTSIVATGSVEVTPGEAVKAQITFAAGSAPAPAPAPDNPTPAPDQPTPAPDQPTPDNPTPDPNAPTPDNPTPDQANWPKQ